ncbi:glycosyltransferase [Candidatus Pelagibacter sp.]|nr:glycosyltransferase [Candidatus Pelagibacter sp.]
MFISRQNLSVVIVTFKSGAVVHDCIKSIGEEIKIIIIENSNDHKFKQELEKIYKNVTCILSPKNSGMGGGNNIGIKMIKTDFVLILNPDVTLEKTTISELILSAQLIPDFAILAPVSSNVKYPNYTLDDKKNFINKKNLPFTVKSVDGFAMLFNKKKIDKIVQTEILNENNNYFDENFFMYLENDDLCKRIRDNKEDIFVAPTSKVNHLGGKAVDLKYYYEVELSRNWHWIWSKFYFNRKHFSYRKAFIEGFPKFLLGLIKYVYFFLIRNKEKQKICFNRNSGFFNAAINKSSWYRPNIKF